MGIWMRDAQLAHFGKNGTMSDTLQELLSVKRRLTDLPSPEHAVERIVVRPHAERQLRAMLAEHAASHSPFLEPFRPTRIGMPVVVDYDGRAIREAWLICLSAAGLIEHDEKFHVPDGWVGVIWYRDGRLAPIVMEEAK